MDKMEKQDEEEITDELDDEPEPEEEVIDYSNWNLASLKQAEAVFRIVDTPEEVIVPIDFEKKLFIKLYIRELPIDEQLRLLETFMTFDKKTGNAKLQWLPYYRSIYPKMVKKTEPPITWKQARFYNKKFMAILLEHLPNPMEMTGEEISGISEKDQKNS